jgi:hypothetical protein
LPPNVSSMKETFHKSQHRFGVSTSPNLGPELILDQKVFFLSPKNNFLFLSLNKHALQVRVLGTAKVVYDSAISTNNMAVLMSTRIYIRRTLCRNVKCKLLHCDS